MHAWLAPFRSGNNHFIYIDFDEETAISMMRIWNYNKSRIHSYRGARYTEIALDGNFIFKGEIQKAPGAMLGASACAECILFTNNDNILKIIEKYDKEPDLPPTIMEGWGGNDLGPTMITRPSTAGDRSKRSGGFDELSRAEPAGSLQSRKSGLGTDGRPLTAAGSGSRSESRKGQIRIHQESEIMDGAGP